MIGGSRLSWLLCVVACLTVTACSGAGSAASSPTPSPSGSAARAAFGERLKSDIDGAVDGVSPRVRNLRREQLQTACVADAGPGEGISYSYTMLVDDGASTVTQLQQAFERKGWTFTPASTITQGIDDDVHLNVGGTAPWGATVNIQATKLGDVGGTPVPASNVLEVRAQTPCVAGELSVTRSAVPSP